MIATKAAYLLVGAALGAGVPTAVGAAGATRPPQRTQPRNAPSATLTLSGDQGRYLQFFGRESRPATFRGSLGFTRPVITGKYTLTFTVRSPGAPRTSLVYDVDARQR